MKFTKLLLLLILFLGRSAVQAVQPTEKSKHLTSMLLPLIIGVR